FRESSELTELLERQRMAIQTRAADLEAQQLEPIPEPPLANHSPLPDGVARGRQQVPQAPRPGRREAEHDELAVGAQDAIDLAQQRVRRRNALEGVRQNHRVDGIGCDRERGRIADQIRLVLRAPADERPALRPRVAQERVPAAPATDLQKLLAEDSFEHPPDDALLVREATPAERRREPVAERLTTMGSAVGHTAILAARMRRAAIASFSTCRRLTTSVRPRISGNFSRCDRYRLPTANRSVASLSMHSSEAGGSTQDNNDQ